MGKIEVSERIDPSQVSSVMGLDLRNNSKNKLPHLHVMGFGELLDATFNLYRKHFLLFLGISAGYCIAILIVISAVFLDDSVGRGAKIAIWIPTIGAFLGASVFMVSGLVFASAEVYQGRSVRIGVVLKQARPQFLRCFAGSLSFGVLAVLVIFLSGVLFLGIFTAFLGNASNIVGPLFILLLIAFVTGGFVTYWCFFAAAVLVEGKSVSDGLGRRGELIHGDWWRIVGTMFAIFLLHFAIGLVFRIAFGFLLSLTGLVGTMEFLRTVQWTTLMQLLNNQPEASLSYVMMFLINLGVDIFTMPIWVIGGTLLYFNQRIRKEGFDIEMMATRQGE